MRRDLIAPVRHIRPHLVEVANIQTSIGEDRIGIARAVEVAVEQDRDAIPVGIFWLS